MKRTLSIFTVMVLLASPVFAYPQPVEKIKGGLTKVVTSPLEVKDYTLAEYKNAKFMPFGLAGGMLKGTFYMAKKVVDGTIDVATFPLK